MNLQAFISFALQRKAIELLTSEPEEVKKVDKHRCLPIHWAFLYGAPHEIIQALVEA